jgi:hypothetical protein
MEGGATDELCCEGELGNGGEQHLVAPCVSWEACLVTWYLVNMRVCSQSLNQTANSSQHLDRHTPLHATNYHDSVKTTKRSNRDSHDWC